MSKPITLIIFAAAALASTALIVPAAGLAAQGWTSVTRNGSPMIEGSGRIILQNRAIQPFQRVEVLGAASVDVRIGARPSLVIAADDNILPLLTSDVKNGTLTLGHRGSFRMRGPIRVSITTPSLEAFTTSGSGDSVIHGVNGEPLAVTINGSSNVQATGRTRQLKLSINGSGNAAFGGLSAGNVDVGLHGSGNATVRASGLARCARDRLRHLALCRAAGEHPPPAPRQRSIIAGS